MALCSESSGVRMVRAPGFDALQRSAQLASPGRLAPLSISVLALTGCSLLTAPAQQDEPAPPPQLPEQFFAESSDNAPVAGADFWMGFEDPELTELVRQATESNRSLTALRQTLFAARANARAAGSAELPTLDASFDASRARQAFVGLPIPGSDGVLATTTDNFGWALGASWEPDLWGRLDAASRRRSSRAKRPPRTFALRASRSRGPAPRRCSRCARSRPASTSRDRRSSSASSLGSPSCAASRPVARRLSSSHWSTRSVTSWRRSSRGSAPNAKPPSGSWRS